MSDFRKSFEDDLEKLIRLFKRLKDKSANQLFTDFDQTLVQNLDFMIKNYETFKNNIPADFLKQMGEPFQQMLRQVIEQLEEELGEDFLYRLDKEESNSAVEKSVVPAVITDGDPQDSTEAMNSQIDEMLGKPGLSEPEINALLDKRLKLVQSKK